MYGNPSVVSVIALQIWDFSFWYACILVSLDSAGPPAFEGALGLKSLRNGTFKYSFFYFQLFSTKTLFQNQSFYFLKQDPSPFLSIFLFLACILLQMSECVWWRAQKFITAGYVFLFFFHFSAGAFDGKKRIKVLRLLPLLLKEA